MVRNVQKVGGWSFKQLQLVLPYQGNSGIELVHKGSKWWCFVFRNGTDSSFLVLFVAGYVNRRQKCQAFFSFQIQANTTPVGRGRIFFFQARAWCHLL